MAELPQLGMVKEQIPCPSHRLAFVLKSIRNEYASFPTDLRDGVKVNLPGGWFHLRGSNTEPVMRLVAEAENEEAARQIAASVQAKVQALL